MPPGNGWGEQKSSNEGGGNQQASNNGWGDNSGQGAWGPEDGAPSGRPDFTRRPKRNDYERKNNWREAHGITNDNLDVTKQAVDNLVQTLQTVEVKLADKQADVNSPLYSVKSFEQLGLYALMHYYTF